MTRFIPRLREVEAILWKGDNLKEIFTLVGRIKQDLSFGQLGIFNPKEVGPGYRICNIGDWVVKFDDGRVLPMAEEDFLDRWEPYPDASAEASAEDVAYQANVSANDAWDRLDK